MSSHPPPQLSQPTAQEAIGLLRWGPWHPLSEPSRFPAEPGLYRIRRVGGAGLDYLGQTGSGSMTLRKRLAMLKGVYGQLMPYRDPHTAGPALWALRHRHGCDFEASTVVVEGDTPWRKGLEAVATSLYRFQTGASPAGNFGRMPAGYRMSSANNNRLRSLGQVFRGGPSAAPDESHQPGIAPAGPLDTDSPTAPGWAGHQWTAWLPLAQGAVALEQKALGLYRLRSQGSALLTYLGEGLIAQRLSAHAKRATDANHPQGRALQAGSLLECSWVVGQGWLKHHRLELENDLIALHLLSAGRVPAAQFLG